MKQTNNALTFLMAQYRAIFKNAYFKGLTSALILTAGLATAQGANADAAAGCISGAVTAGQGETDANDGVYTGYTDWAGASAGGSNATATISGSAEFKTDGNKKLHYYKNITVQNGGALTNGLDNATSIVHIAGALNIQSGGKLTVAATGKIAEILGAKDNSTNLDSGKGVLENAGTIVLGNGSNAKIQMKNVTLKSGSTTTLKGVAHASPGDQNKIFGDYTALLGASIGDAPAFTIENGATLNLNEYSHIVVGTKGKLDISGTVKMNASGGLAAIRGSDATNAAGTSPATNNTTVNFNSGSVLEVSSSGEKVVAAILAPTVTFNGATVNVKANSTLLLNGDIAAKTTVVDLDNVKVAADEFRTGNFTLKSGEINVGAGGTLIVGNGVYGTANGDSFQPSGSSTKLTVDGGTISLKADSTLDVRGILELNTDQNFDNGTISLSTSRASGSEYVDGQILVKKGTLTIGKNATLAATNGSNANIANITLSGGNLNVTGNALNSFLTSGGYTYAQKGEVTLNGDLALNANVKVSNALDETVADNTKHLILASGSKLNVASGNLQSNAAKAMSVNTGVSVNIDSKSTLTVNAADAADADADADGNKYAVFVNGGDLTFEAGAKLALQDGTLFVAGSKVDLSEATLVSGSAGTLEAGEKGEIDFAKAEGITLTADADGKVVGQEYKVALDDIKDTGGSLNIADGGVVQIDSLTLTSTASPASHSGTLVIGSAINLDTNVSGDANFSSGVLKLGADSSTNGTLGTNLKLTGTNETTVLGTWKATDKALTLSGSSELSVGDGTNTGNLEVSTIEVGTGNNLTVNSGSSLTVEGKAPAANDSFSGGESGYYGFDLEGVTVNVKDGTFVIGSTAADHLLNKAFVAGSTEAGKDDYVYDNFGQYKLTTKGSTLQLNFATGTTFDVDQFTQLKKELLALGTTVDKDGNILTGTLSLGNATVAGLADSLIETDEETGEKSADFKEFTNSPITGTELEQFADVQLTNVDDEVQGANVGSLQLAAGETEATIGGGQGSSLSHAVKDADGNDALIVDAEGAVAGATIKDGVALTLKDSGAVGDITLKDGTAQDQSTIALVNKDTANAQTNTIASVFGTVDGTADGDLLDNTAFAVGSTDTATGAGAVNATVANGVAAGTVSTAANSSLTVQSGDVVANTLANNGKLTLSDASGSISTGIYTSDANSALTAQTVTIDGVGAKDNASVVAGEITVNSTDKDVENPGFVLASQAASDGTVTKAQLTGKVHADNTVAQLTNADVGVGGELTAFSASLTNSDIAGTVNVKYDNSAEGAEADDYGFALVGYIKDDKLQQKAQLSGTVNADKTAADLQYVNVASGGIVNALAADLVGTDIAADGTINVKSTDSESIGFSMQSGLNEEGTDKPILAKLDGKVEASGTDAFLSDVAVGESGSLNVASVQYGNTIDVAGTVTTTNTFIGQEAITEGEDTTEGFTANVTFSSNNDLGDVTFADYADDTGAGSTLTINADVTAKNITGNENSFIQVGSAGEDGSTGYLAADNINLDGGVWQIDPSFGKDVAIGVASTVGDVKDVKEGTAGTINFQVRALQNSIVAIGLDKEEGTREALEKTFARYLKEDTHSLTQDNVGAILYVAKPVDVADGQKIIVSSELTDADVSRSSNGDVVNSSNANAADLNEVINNNDAYIGANSAIAVNAGSAQQEGKAAITFQKEDATIFAAEGAKIVLAGDGFDPSKPVTIFTDQKDGVEFAEGSSVENLTVSSALGLFEGEAKLNDNGELVVSGLEIVDTSAQWAGVSAPMQATLEDYYAKFAPNDDPDDPTNSVLYYSLMEEIPFIAEKVARLGTYGGAAQAALAAGSTTYEAVSGRMGIGATGANITVADNTQGAALWLSPVYKSRNSDGFGAQGVEYGTDIDLYGLALGADYTLANGFKIGAAFNIGSGDADGNGAGDGVNNDFDYYGFALYGSYTNGPWSVVADVSYTKVDNDIEFNPSIIDSKFNTSFDSSNLSLGVTAQYQALLDGDVTITPHVGLRYTKIDLDNYTVTDEDGAPQAAFSTDDLNVFSIPFGVTVAKEFVNGSWTVKPSFDLTLTANMGDDSVDGSVYWGDEIDNTLVSSEVLDNFTYGATVGVAAKSGNFSLGFGLNYTGSSNTDEFSVNANARFVF